MRVGLDISQAVKYKVRGIARYIREILPHMLAQTDGVQLEPVIYVRGDRILRRGPLAGIRSDTVVRWMPLRLYLVGSGLDLFHSFGNYLPARSRVPLTFTAHDFRVLDLNGERSSNRLAENVRRSSGIVCLTEHGRSRLLHHFPQYDTQRIAIIPHGVDHSRFYVLDQEAAGATAATYGLEKPYLLQLGSWFPHKNLEASINAFALSRARQEGISLAFVGGGADNAYRNQLRDLVSAKGLEDQVIWIEDIPAGDIPAVVSTSLCLLQPSRYEGFALPLLESMAVGTPGVASDSTCLPEVTAGAWPIFRQDQVEEMAQHIDSMVLDSHARQTAIDAGLKRAAKFTWEKSARKTIEFFAKIIGQVS